MMRLECVSALNSISSLVLVDEGLLAGSVLDRRVFAAR